MQAVGASMALCRDGRGWFQNYCCVALIEPEGKIQLQQYGVPTWMDQQYAWYYLGSACFAAAGGRIIVALLTNEDGGLMIDHYMYSGNLLTCCRSICELREPASKFRGRS